MNELVSRLTLMLHLLRRRLRRSLPAAGRATRAVPRARRLPFVASATALMLGLFAAAGDVQAQSGGSMGGGDWSSSSSSSSSGGGSYSSSSSDSSYSYSGGGYSSSDSSWSSGRSSGTSGGEFLLILLAGGVFLVVSIIKSANQSRAPVMPLSMGMDSTSAWGRAEADVTVLRFALDARVRKFVQAELARIGLSANTATAEGRAQMLREVALLLRRTRDAWVYGGAVNEMMTDLTGAKQQFDRHVSDARGRFMHEVVRNAQGVITTASAPAVAATSADGPGLVVVTLVIAARTELFSVRTIGNGDDLRQALESASNRAANDLIAIEIIWMPAEADESLSSIAVEAKYPHPDLVKLQGALVGKVFCQYCSGPYPAELVSCPHCGGRAA